MKIDIKLICEKLNVMQAESTKALQPKHPQYDKIIERVSELKTDIESLFEDQEFLNFHLKNRIEEEAEKSNFIFLRYLPKHTLSLNFRSYEFYIVGYGEYLSESKIEILLADVLNIKEYIYKKIPNYLKYRTGAFSLDLIDYEFPITTLPKVHININEQWNGLW